MLNFLVILALSTAFSFVELHCRKLFIIASALIMMPVATATLRRSARLRGRSGSRPRPVSNKLLQSPSDTNNEKPNKRQRRSKSKPRTSKVREEAESEPTCLPRTEEKKILFPSSESNSSGIQYVIGVDEAGRGPLAGPVVAAAVIIGTDIDGITDSKKVTVEEDREYLYQKIVESDNVRWSVAVMDAPFIDRVNILQATMAGMTAATSVLISGASSVQLGSNNLSMTLPKIPVATFKQSGCYVVSGKNAGDNVSKNTSNYFAFVDGNRIPNDMPCGAKPIVKGDSKEYCIAAASIVAKVTRDRLMRDYDKLWPHYGLQQHKGYPTKAHMDMVKLHGASSIHRRTFRPLKNMTFDKDGKILQS